MPEAHTGEGETHADYSRREWEEWQLGIRGLPAAAVRSYQGIFEDHYGGVVNLVGENEDDDARGLLKSNEQQLFLDNADLSRRGQYKERAPRAGTTASPSQ